MCVKNASKRARLWACLVCASLLLLSNAAFVRLFCFELGVLSRSRSGSGFAVPFSGGYSVRFRFVGKSNAIRIFLIFFLKGGGGGEEVGFHAETKRNEAEKTCLGCAHCVHYLSNRI